jgi:outer membrane protein TolC
MKNKSHANSAGYKLILMLLFLFIPESFPQKIWTLEECIDTALVNNRNLQISSNNILSSKEKHKEAVANLIPKINLTTDYKYFVSLPYQLMPMSAFGGPEGQFKETQFGVPHNINASVQLNVPVYNPGIYGAINTTDVAVDLAKMQHEKSAEQVIYEVSNLYLNAQVLYHQKDFLDSNIANTSKLLSNIRLLREQLMAKRTDEEKVELQRSQLITQSEIVNSNLEQILNGLKLAMGQSAGKDIQIVREISYEQPGEYSVSPATEIKLAEMQNKLLISELGTLKKSWLPVISLYGSYSQTGFGYTEQPNDFLKFFPSGFAGIQMQLPLFNGTVTHRKINQKKIDISNNELQIMQLTDQNNIQIINAKNRRETALRTIHDTEKQIQLARSVYDNTLLQQKEGTASLTEVLLADAALMEAQQTNISAIIEYLKSDLELKKVTGNITVTNLTGR